MSSNPIQIQILSRVASLPLINSAIGLATDGYSRIKSYNSLVSATLSRAEKSLLFVASNVVTTAQPVINKFEKPIQYADTIACQGLDKLEQRVPAIKKSPEELRDETKRLYEGSFVRIGEMKKYGNDKITSIKDYGLTKVGVVLESTYVKAFLKSVDTAIDLTNNAVDHYLPPAANEPRKDEEKGKNVVVRMGYLSDKMRRRMYDQVISKWLPLVFVSVSSVKANLSSWLSSAGARQHSMQTQQ